MFQFHWVRLIQCGRGLGKGLLQAFQFHWVRLIRNRYAYRLTTYEFQFHWVRLIQLCFLFPNVSRTEFQFHWVRLIPYNQQFTKAHPGFNSIGCD